MDRAIACISCGVGRLWSVLLCGGDKSSQAGDIALAKAIAAQWEGP